jgi:hypothetical protein
MCGGADCIYDLDIVRVGGMKTLFGGVSSPSTIGTLLRELIFGHARQLESVLTGIEAPEMEHVRLLGMRAPAWMPGCQHDGRDAVVPTRPSPGHRPKKPRA